MVLSINAKPKQDLGGYSSEVPPLPIPNREVKLTIADGTAPPGGRVGSCHFLIRKPSREHLGGFFVVSRRFDVLHASR